MVSVAVLGAWLMGSLVIAFVATQNFRAVDRLMRSASENPEIARRTERLGPTEARALLRHLASEMNRFYFRAWDRGQVVLGLLLLLSLWGGNVTDRVVRGAAVGMFALVLFFVFYLTPTLIALGRPWDFVPRDPLPPGYARFWRLHALSVLLDLVKMGLGVIALLRLIRSS